MILPRHKKMSVLGIGGSVSTPYPDGITSEVIVANNFKEFYDIPEDMIKGKIVLFNVNFTNYMEVVKYRVDSASIAAKKGAVAVLVKTLTPFSLYTPHTGALRYVDSIKKIPAASITLEDTDLINRFYRKGKPVVIHLKLFSTRYLKKSRNTIIDLEGTEEPEKIVIVSGHMDSWDVGQGAIDNGGGMMISWVVPIVLHILNIRPKRTIRAILWTGEEQGLIGGKAYIKKHKNELDQIDYVLESDAGTFEPEGLRAAGSTSANCIIKIILEILYPINKLIVDNNVGSELSLFIKEGIPGASLLTKDDRYFWYHHSEADTINAQNQTSVEDCAVFWTALAYIIADFPVDIPRD